MQNVTLEISGMSCGHCVAAVQRALKSVAGVIGDQVRVGSADVAIDPSVDAADTIAARAIDAIRDAGYDARLSGDTTTRAPVTQAGLPVMGSCCSPRRS